MSHQPSPSQTDPVTLDESALRPDKTEGAVPDTRQLSADAQPNESGSQTLSLRELSGSHMTPPAPLASSDAKRLGRYELRGEIGRGGMGSVLLGHDPDLNRDLALKVLLDRHRGRDAESRFLEEAQIGGQLEHPGIVPVYEMGRIEGRSFFAMKLIQGRTLSALLAERKTPADDLPRFLLIFEQMCQALAYAHARGVIHRDLKPSNVMVGAFGEVQVMDWGLAKVLDQTRRESHPSEKEQGAIRTQRSESEVDESHTGSVLGTPAYMPPEQARGEIDRLDERADVFGLGAILCEILTGKPPFVGANVSAVLNQAANGDLTQALGRLTSCGADEELTRLVRECLRTERDGRPRNAGVIAARISAYRAGVQERLHKTELERVAAEARAQEAQAKAQAERRARRLTLGLAASVLLTVLLGGGTLGYLYQRHLKEHAAQERREAAVTQAIDDNLRQASESMRQSKWEDAGAAIKSAEATLTAGPAPEKLRERVGNVKADLDMASRLEEIRLEQSNAAATGDFDYASAETKYREAFAGYGLKPETAEAAATAELIRGSAIRVQLIEALDDWALVKGRLKTDGRERLLAAAGAADEDAWRKEFRQALLQNDVAAMKRLAAALKVDEVTPATLAMVGHSLNRAGERPLAIELLRAGQRRYPGDFWLNQRLGLYLSDGAGADPEGAVGYFRAAVAQRPKSPAASNLAGALYSRGKLAEAEVAYREAVRQNPNDAWPHFHLALVLNARKENAEAEQEARAAFRLKPTLGGAHNELGVALLAQQKIPEAIAAFQESKRLDSNVGLPCRNLGFVFEKQEKFDLAEAEFREAARREPKSASFQRELGSYLKRRRKLDEAGTAYVEANRLQPNNASNHYNLGVLRFEQEQFPAAESALREAVRLKPDYVDANLFLGNTLATQGKSREAEAAYSQTLRYAPDSIYASFYLGRLLFLEGEFADAVPLLRRTYELGQKNADWKMASVMADEAEKLMKLEGTVSGLLSPEMRPAFEAELSEGIAICQHKKLFAVASRIYDEAFIALPELAEERDKDYRYDAARNAVKAAAGLGTKLVAIDELDCNRLRRQALRWLRADLAAWEKQRANASAMVEKKLLQWQKDADLGTVREKDMLTKLSAVERAEWEKLWRDVEALLVHVRGDGK